MLARHSRLLRHSFSLSIYKKRHTAWFCVSLLIVFLAGFFFLICPDDFHFITISNFSSGFVLDFMHLIFPLDFYITTISEIASGFVLDFMHLIFPLDFHATTISKIASGFVLDFMHLIFPLDFHATTISDFASDFVQEIHHIKKALRSSGRTSHFLMLICSSPKLLRGRCPRSTLHSPLPA